MDRFVVRVGRQYLSDRGFVDMTKALLFESVEAARNFACRGGYGNDAHVETLQYAEYKHKIGYQYD